MHVANTERPLKPSDLCLLPPEWRIRLDLMKFVLLGRAYKSLFQTGYLNQLQHLKNI